MKFRRAPHTRCHRGKRVCIVLRDGARLVGKFVCYGSTWVQLDTGRVQKREMRSMNIIRGRNAV